MRVRAAQGLGISLKRFDGWEARTAYEYDEAGRLVSSAPETEWDATEQAYMLALAEYDKGLCSQCGGDLDETLDPANEDGYRHLPPMQCARCVQFDRAREEYESQPHSRSLMHRVVLKKRRASG